jgi:DNA-binding MarR family transcriptional regulator
LASTGCGPPMIVNETIDLLLQLSRALLAEFDSGELTTAQWIALRYFSRANCMSRTLTGFAKFQATTAGTASQTIKFLEQSGLLERDVSVRDARSSVFTLTEAGRRVIARSPLNHLATEIEGMRQADIKKLQDTLRFLLENISGQHARHAFGTCHDCAFLLTRQIRNRRDSFDKQYFCRMTTTPIESHELDLLCKNFSCLTARPNNE